MKKEKEKNKTINWVNTLIAIFILEIVGLIIAIFLILNGNLTLRFDTIPTSDKQEQPPVETKETTNTENNYNTSNEEKLDVNELKKIGSSDYNFLKQEGTTDYTFNLSIDGKININFENDITNINNAKDIILFNTPSDSNLYILTTNGDIYKYDYLNYKQKNYNAVKLNEYSNIKKMITYNTRKAHAGGCDYIIVIDNNNKYYELDSSCV